MPFADLASVLCVMEELGLKLQAPVSHAHKGQRVARSEGSQTKEEG